MAKVLHKKGLPSTTIEERVDTLLEKVKQTTTPEEIPVLADIISHREGGAHIGVVRI